MGIGSISRSPELLGMGRRRHEGGRSEQRLDSPGWSKRQLWGCFEQAGRWDCCRQDLWPGCLARQRDSLVLDRFIHMIGRARGPSAEPVSLLLPSPSPEILILAKGSSATVLLVLTWFCYRLLERRFSVSYRGPCSVSAVRSVRRS